MNNRDELKLLVHSVDVISQEGEKSFNGLFTVTLFSPEGFDFTLRPQKFFANDFKIEPCLCETPFTMQTDCRVKIERSEEFCYVNFL